MPTAFHGPFRHAMVLTRGPWGRENEPLLINLLCTLGRGRENEPLLICHAAMLEAGHVQSHH
jgi:hypothetical protein